MKFKAEFFSSLTVRSIDVDDDLSLLDHGLANGIDIDFACKRGDCGQCAATLVRGVVQTINVSKPGNRGREIYLCNVVPRTDVGVSLPYLPETAHVRVLRSPCKINELRKLSSDVMEVTLRLPPAGDFNFIPGQYIRLTNKSKITRSYSLAEGPSNSKLLRIHVKRVAGGCFSEQLFSSALVGDLLHLEGPMGRFFVREQIKTKKTIFLATGTGIAPVHAILTSMDGTQRQRCGDIYLYYGNRNREDAYLHPDLEGIVAKLQAKYFPVFSGDHQAIGAICHVQDLMSQHHADLVDAQVFACGNAAMIESARHLCMGVGLDAERFFSDTFTAS